MGRRKRITYRPSKGQGVFGLIFGGIFVLIGLFFVIPVFGLFGILWTAIAVGITAYQGYVAFGTSYKGPEIHIEDEDEPSSPAPVGQGVEARLAQLQSLYDQGLITREEYDQKRKEILEDL